MNAEKKAGAVKPLLILKGGKLSFNADYRAEGVVCVNE